MTGNTQNAQTRNALQARDNYYLGQWQAVSGGIRNSILNKGQFGDMITSAEGGEQMDYTKDFFTSPNEMLLEANDIIAGYGDANTKVGALFTKSLPNQIGAGFRAGTNIAGTVGQMLLNKEAYSHQMPYSYATTPLVVGTNSNFSSLILPQKAFIQVRRRNRVKASNYHMTNGYVEMRTHRLGDLQGFTTCINPKLDIKAMPQELAEIYAQLQSGVYIGS